MHDIILAHMIESPCVTRQSWVICTRFRLTPRPSCFLESSHELSEKKEKQPLLAQDVKIHTQRLHRLACLRLGQLQTKVVLVLAGQLEARKSANIRVRGVGIVWGNFSFCNPIRPSSVVCRVDGLQFCQQPLFWSTVQRCQFCEFGVQYKKGIRTAGSSQIYEVSA